MVSKDLVTKAPEQGEFGFTSAEDGSDQVKVLYTGSGERVVLPIDLVNGIARAALSGTWTLPDFVGEISE